MTKRQPTYALYTLLFAVLTLAGCDERGPTQENSGPKEISAEQIHSLVKQPQSSFIAAVPDSVTANLSNSQGALKRSWEELHSFRELATEAETWKKAHEAVRARLTQPSPVPQFRREQMAGHVMLTEWLNEGNLAPKKREALSFYTRLMVRNESPQVLELSKALVRLEGHWSSSRIARAAQTVLTSAQSQFGPKLDASESGAIKLNLEVGETISLNLSETGARRSNGEAQRD